MLIKQWTYQAMERSGDQAADRMLRSLGRLIARLLDRWSLNWQTCLFQRICSSQLENSFEIVSVFSKADPISLSTIWKVSLCLNWLSRPENNLGIVFAFRMLDLAISHCGGAYWHHAQINYLSLVGHLEQDRD